MRDRLSRRGCDVMHDRIRPPVVYLFIYCCDMKYKQVKKKKKTLEKTCNVM